MGLSGGEAVNSIYTQDGDSSQKIVVDDLICTGDEATLGECQGKFGGSNNCDHSEDIGVICGEGRNIISSKLRIVDNNNRWVAGGSGCTADQLKYKNLITKISGSLMGRLE